MIRLKNGVEFDFIASAGSRGWSGVDDGHGYARAWKAAWRWALPDVPVVAKTVTRHPNAGNYDPWRPWRCVRTVPGGLVNCMALPNPGIDAWVRDYYPLTLRRRFPVFASIAPADDAEAAYMTSLLDSACPGLAGVEVNLSCPNVEHNQALANALAVYTACLNNAGRHPVIPKLAYQDDYLSFVKIVRNGLQAVHLINTIPWDVYAGSLVVSRPSPLAPYGLKGGVSGEPLAYYSRVALRRVRSFLGPDIPVISGGGVMDAFEASGRFADGADAVGLGTVFLLRPWRVRRIVRCRPLKERSPAGA
jgi:dihydroorotate dehydrogenase (NAD+) catalytic subunit